jgi:telomerase reverse transcriptase
MKKLELFSDFLLWLFEEFLIPLIKNNFYVTETSCRRNAIFYFRHDLWQKLANPFVKSLCMTRFELIPQDQLKAFFSNRVLGYSYVRMLPKETGFRPITNLKRRQLKVVIDELSLFLGFSHSNAFGEKVLPIH